MHGNVWLVDEMYEQYLADPSSVSESWQEFFARLPAATTPPAPTPPAARRPRPRRRPRRPLPRRRRRPGRGPAPAAGARGRAAASRSAAPAPRIVANMEAASTVPTATSFRDVPAKLLEVNRRVINGYLGRTGRRQGQLHPPHRLRRRAGHRRRRAGDEQRVRRGRRRQAAHRAPRARQPRPRRRRRQVRRQPHARRARARATPTRSTSRGFLAAYEDLIRKVRTNKLTPRRLRRAPPSRSPTRARSAPCSRCRG